MHFSGVCATKEPDGVYELMAPFQEVGYDEEGNDLSEYDCIKFYDWFEVGGRRAGIIKLKKGCKGYMYPDNDAFKEQESNLKKGSCSVARKRDIDHFNKGEKDSDAYPHARMYFDEHGYPQFQPEEFEWDVINRTTIKNENIEKDLKEYYNKLETWYENVPDNYYIIIIDYHD